ncbi:DUF6461 domain-containing protein [Streptomyces sp. NBC_00996]|uniref:DUF6461 domain-containing protein n=1 Tax=Streptomyces sp. NBC_00996 TaxID=2903710 RepID=UPI00386A3CF6|nr:DUF6461 domain-containing protein [Streptomyces sp. NBC_00996]
MDGIAWIREALDAYCVTFARGLSVDELVRRLGTDPARILPSVSAHEAELLARDEGPVARLGTGNGWAFALESASAEGTDRRTLRRVSEGTEAVMLLDSGMPPYWFVHARNGEIAADFEPGVEAEQIGGTDPSFLVPAMQTAGMLLADGTANPEDWEPEQRIITVAEQVFSLDLPRAAVESGTLPAVVLV